MTLRTYSHKILGLLSLIMLSSLSLLTVSAQANWLVSGAELKANESLSAGPHNTYTRIVKNLNLEIQCTTLAASNLKLLASSAKAEGTIKTSNCTTFSPIGSGKAMPNCKPVEPINLGFIFLVILHNGQNYILDDPLPGKALTIMEFSELCSLTETSEITGTMVLECGHLSPPGTWVFLSCSTSSGTQLVRPASITLFPTDTLKFGENSMTTTGITSLTLAGANAGKTWAGHI